MGRVVIAGGSGFLGMNLARRLAERCQDIVILSRRAPKVAGPWRHVTWDARTCGEWTHELNGATAIVNLAGRSVDCIKTPDHCDEILRSRVEATLTLGRAVRHVENPPPVWVQMSTAHIYGDPPELVCDENSPTGYGLAPHVGRAWEAAFAESRLETMRTVVLRTSFVLGRNGGALPKMVTLARLGLGGRVGHGQQGISWLHEHDMNRLFERAIDDPSMQGVFVATAPHPVSYATFMRTLRRVIGTPVGLPAPAWLVRLGAPLVMRTDPELVLYGRYCVSQRLKESGFEFQHPTIDVALRDLLRKDRARDRTTSATAEAT